MRFMFELIKTKGNFSDENKIDTYKIEPPNTTFDKFNEFNTDKPHNKRVEFVDFIPIEINKPKFINLEYKKYYYKLINKLSHCKTNKTKDYRKRCYYVKVWYYTLKNNLTLLENYENRSYSQYHIDHIVPISYGYKNGIPSKVIGNILNLRMLFHTENIEKSDKMTNDSLNTLEKLNLIINKNYKLL